MHKHDQAAGVAFLFGRKLPLFFGQFRFAAPRFFFVFGWEVAVLSLVFGFFTVLHYSTLVLCK